MKDHVGIGRFVPVLCLTLGLARAADYYSSTYHIRQASQRTEKFLNHLEWYADSEERRLQELRRSISEVRTEFSISNLRLREEHYDVTSDDIDHPIGAFKFIRKWHRLCKLTENDQNVARLKDAVEASSIPLMSDMDILGATNAITRLQRVYNLSVRDILTLGRGTPNHTSEIQENHARLVLPPEDMEFIGLRAFTVGEPITARDWFMEALNLYRTHVEPQYLKTRSSILLNLAKIHVAIGDNDKALDSIQEALYLDPENETISEFLGDIETSLKAEANSSVIKQVDGKRTTGPGNCLGEICHSLCRGEEISSECMPEVNDSGPLFCRYRPTLVPYSRVKEEVLSLDPRIMIFYDVISEETRMKILDMAAPRLKRAVVKKSGKQVATEGRVSKTAWLFDAEDALVARLSRQVTIHTGLETVFRAELSSSEPFQVNNYGLAGHYGPHHDYFDTAANLKSAPSYALGSGDRIATFMLYLSDVKAGGATAFPELNIRVPPVKGAAVFWYNIKRSGAVDPRTLHIGCPVLLGEKWVANKWIHEYGQEKARPCGLDINEPG